MRFEWDKNKAIENSWKHDVTFELGARIFLDPNRLEEFDRRESPNEDRWKTIGQIEHGVFVVVYTVRDNNGEVIRLISARKATKNEQSKYQQF